MKEVSMKCKLILFTLFCVFLALPSNTMASPEQISRPLTFGGPQIQIEDLTAELVSDGKILLISGKIKNMGQSKVRGYVTVYLKNANHDVINGIDADVNKNKPIARGQSGSFEATVRVDDHPGLANVSVEFVEAHI